MTVIIDRIQLFVSIKCITAKRSPRIFLSYQSNIYRNAAKNFDCTQQTCETCDVGFSTGAIDKPHVISQSLIFDLFYCFERECYGEQKLASSYARFRHYNANDISPQFIIILKHFSRQKWVVVGELCSCLSETSTQYSFQIVKTVTNWCAPDHGRELS